MAHPYCILVIRKYSRSLPRSLSQPSDQRSKKVGETRRLVAGLATLLLDDVGELFELALGAEEGAEL
jgi:hypothetical protein